MKINLKSVRILSKKNIKNHLIEETDQEQIVVLRAQTLRLGLSEYHLPYHGIKFNIDGYLLDNEVQQTLSLINTVMGVFFILSLIQATKQQIS